MLEVVCEANNLVKYHVLKKLMIGGRWKVWE
jgi:hypothetical protein